MSSSPQQAAVVRMEATTHIHALAGAAHGSADAAQLQARLEEVSILQKGLGRSRGPGSSDLPPPPLPPRSTLTRSSRRTPPTPAAPI